MRVTLYTDPTRKASPAIYACESCERKLARFYLPKRSSEGSGVYFVCDFCAYQENTGLDTGRLTRRMTWPHDWYDFCEHCGEIFRGVVTREAHAGDIDCEKLRRKAQAIARGKGRAKE